MKKVGKYIIISLLLLLGLGCVGVLYLFFIPNSTLFGITYINLNKTIESLEYESSAVEQITVNSRSYKVKILPTERNTISLEIFSNSFGFVHKNHKETIVTSSLKDNVLTFNVDEAYGFAIPNNSYINVYIPSSSSLNLNLTNKNAPTSINSEAVEIKNLSYSTKKGDFNFVLGKVNGMLNLNLNKSTFTINKEVITNKNNVHLSISKGKFLAKDSVLGDVTIKKSERGVISINECNEFKDDLTSTSRVINGGQININKLFKIGITSSDTIISIGEITNGANIKASKSGNITIDKINTKTYITSESGNISIHNCNARAILQTDSGNINVNNAVEMVIIKTNSGNANVKFSDEAAQHTAENNARTLCAIIHDGNLTATGVQHIGLVTENESDLDQLHGIKITGKGSVVINMNNVLGENSIEGNNGNINIVVDSESEFILNTSSISGNVRVNLMQISDHNGYTTKEATTTIVNCNNSPNSLNVTTNNGGLTILDSIMHQHGF